MKKPEPRERPQGLAEPKTAAIAAEKNRRKNMQLGKNMKLTKVALSGSAGSEVLTGAIDMQGYDGAVAFVTVATANAGNYMKATQCDTSGGSYADLTGTKTVPLQNGDVALIDVYKPTERYLKFSVIRAGASTVLGEIYVLQYKGTKVPETQAATTIASYVVSPAETTIS